MRKRSISMFWKFVFSYALVLMISFGFLFAVVWNSICSLNEAVIDSNWFQFINGVESINAIAADVEMLSARISKDSQLNSRLELSDGSQPLDYTDIYEVCASISNINAHPTVIGAYIFLLGGIEDVLITPEFATKRVEMTYNSELNLSDMSYSEFRNMLMVPNANDRVVALRQSNDEYIGYIKPLFSTKYFTLRGAILILIDGQALLDNILYDETGSNECGGIAVDNTLAIQRGKFASDDAVLKALSDMSVNRHSTEVSGYNGHWVLLSADAFDQGIKCYRAIESNSFTAIADSIWRMFLMVVLTLLLFEAVVIYLLARRHSMPIRSIIQALLSDGSLAWRGKDEYEFIENAMHDMLSNNRQLKEYARQQQETMRNTVLKSMFSGAFVTENSLQLALSQLQLTLTGDAFICIAIAPDQSAELSRVASFAVTLLQAQTELCVLALSTEDAVMVALGFDEGNRPFTYSAFALYMRELIAQIESLLHIHVRIGGGTRHNRRIYISQSADEARRALKYCPVGEYMPYDVLMKQEESCYTIEQEHALVESVRCGNARAVREFCDQYRQKYFIDEDASPLNQEFLVGQMAHTLMRIRRECVLDDMDIGERIDFTLAAINLDDDNEALYELITGTLERIALSTHGAAPLHPRSKLADDILAYIHANYSDANLSMALLADHFNRSEKTLSVAFKEQMGVSITNYIETQRMMKAIELIQSTDLSMHEIALKIGYQSDNTFFKAFKRIYGTPPSAYKSRQTN